MEIKKLVKIVLPFLLGVWTLLPWGASKPCLLGYYAHCTFTPISTIVCFGATAYFLWKELR